MAETSTMPVITEPSAAVTAVGATDALVFRRASGGRYVLTTPAPPGIRDELLVDDEPAVQQALTTGVCRVAAEQPRPVCAGYRARAAAVVAVDPDVVVVLGRADGCLAGVDDQALVAAAAAVALAEHRRG
ncbi:MAG TPA: hypothetical protein VM307_13510 [Egibacteraceae bacterium]|nr:hypothetical protein [Egibacteraceae bacterium]